MTPKSLQSRLKIAKNAKFGSTEAGAKAEAEEGVVVSSLGERDETETDEGDGRADLARGTCSACLFVDHTCVREENNTQTDPLDHFGAQGEKAEEEDAELVLTEDERRGVALLTDEAVGMARQLVRLYDFEGLCRQVATWWDELEQGVVRGTGALVHRLRHRFSVARQFDAFLGSELFERHGLAAVLGPRKRSVLEEFADVIIR